MKILIAGARGMLGTDLVKRLKVEEYEVIVTDIEELDITIIDDVNKFIKREKPDLVINCVAYTQVDKAEAEKHKAFLINAEGVKNLAISCNENKVLLCHISTDYVFDGRKQAPYLPEDRPNPINTYGYTKYQGEKFLMETCSKYYIIRTSWLYGLKGNNFVHTILRLAKETDQIKVVNDQIGAPTWTVTLSEAIACVIKKGELGIYHITDDAGDGISWYDFASEIIRLSNLKTKIIPIKTEDYPTAARRPLYSLLEISKIKKLMEGRIPCWKDSLNCFLSNLRNANLL